MQSSSEWKHYLSSASVLRSAVAFSCVTGLSLGLLLGSLVTIASCAKLSGTKPTACANTVVPDRANTCTISNPWSLPRGVRLSEATSSGPVLSVTKTRTRKLVNKRSSERTNGSRGLGAQEMLISGMPRWDRREMLAGAPYLQPMTYSGGAKRPIQLLGYGVY